MHITDKEVDAAAKAIGNRHLSNTGVPFPFQACRNDARAALEAVLEPTQFWTDSEGTRVAMARTDECPRPLYALKEPQP